MIPSLSLHFQSALAIAAGWIIIFFSEWAMSHFPFDGSWFLSPSIPPFLHFMISIRLSLCLSVCLSAMPRHHRRRIVWIHRDASQEWDNWQKPVTEFRNGNHASGGELQFVSNLEYNWKQLLMYYLWSTFIWNGQGKIWYSLSECYCTEKGGRCSCCFLWADSSGWRPFSLSFGRLIDHSNFQMNELFAFTLFFLSHLWVWSTLSAVEYLLPQM